MLTPNQAKLSCTGEMPFFFGGGGGHILLRSLAKRKLICFASHDLIFYSQSVCRLFSGSFLPGHEKGFFIDKKNSV
jgi:hypothetical protein